MSEAAYERLDAWSKAIDLPLLNAAIQLVLNTTNKAGEYSKLHRHLFTHFWYDPCNADEYFSPYGIRYMGELLERYREKIGSRPCHTRAIALALALTQSAATDSMFNGAQKQGFLRQLKREALTDPYLLCARYLLEPSERGELLKQIRQYDFRSAEELIFMIDIMYDYENLLPQFDQQLIHMLSGEQKLPVYGNTGIYATLLSRLWEDGHVHKKKKNSLFGALMKLRSSYVRPKSRAEQQLFAAEYTRLELCYLNATLLWEDHLPGGLSLNGTPAERLAVELMIQILNAASVLPSVVYNFASELLYKYRYFKPKIDGYDSIWDAIKHHITPNTPEAVAWIANHINYSYDVTFDILDKKWDSLVTLVNTETYHDLFRLQLSHNKISDSQQVPLILQRYEELTGTPYINVFQSYSWYEDAPFAFLVNTGVISLISYFEANQDIQNTQCQAGLRYISKYAIGCQTRQAYDFLTFFFSTHTAHDWRLYFPENKYFCDAFFGNASSYHYGYLSTLDFKRSFLNSTEQRQLYEWIDESFMICHAEEYPRFLAGCLQKDEVRELYTQEELRAAYDVLATNFPKENSSQLKRLYLSDEELEADRLAHEELERIAALKREEELRARYKEQLDSEFDGTITSLAKQCDRYIPRDSTKVMAEILLEKLSTMLTERVLDLTSKEIANLLRLCAFLAQHLHISLQHITSILGRIKEVIAHDEGHPEC